MTITDERLAELRALADAATPGPWGFANGHAIVRGLEVTGRSSYCCISSIAEMADASDREDWSEHEDYVFVEPEADGELIVAAVNALPELLAEAERIRTELAGAKPDGWESTAALQEAYTRTEADLLTAQDEQKGVRAELARHEAFNQELIAGQDNLRAELAKTRDALADCVVKATEYGTQDGGFVAMYLLPTGPIHRAIPMLDAVGINVRPGFDGRKAAPSATEEAPR